MNKTRILRNFYFSLKSHNLAQNHPNFASWGCFGILRASSWRWSQRFLKLMHPGLRNWRKQESSSYWDANWIFNKLVSPADDLIKRRPKKKLIASILLGIQTWIVVTTFIHNIGMSGVLSTIACLNHFLHCASFYLVK